MNALLMFFGMSTEVPTVWAFPALQREDLDDNPQLQQVFDKVLPLLAERLVGVASPDEFEIALDTMLGEQLIGDAYGLMVDLGLSAERPAIDLHAELRPEVAQFLGEQAAAHLKAHRRDLTGALVAVDSLLQTAPKEALEQARVRRPLDWFVVDENIPIPVRRLALAWTYGAVCAAVGGHCIVNRHRVPDWLGVLLAHHIATGARQYLRYCASLDGSPVRGLVPPEDLLPLADFEQQHGHAMWGLRLSVLLHQQSGRSVSRLFGESSDGDDE